MAKFYTRCFLILAAIAATARSAKQPQTLRVAYLQIAPLQCVCTAITASSSFPRCYLKNPNYEKCLISAVETSFQMLAKGLPSLGLQPIDPMVVTEMGLAQGSGAVTVDLIFRNTSMTGFKDSKIITTSNDLLSGSPNMYGEMIIPRLNLLSNYKISGRILLLPIHGEGVSNITILNMKSTYKMENEIIKKKNGQEYIKVNSFTMKLRPGKSYINFDNLFGGDKRLSDQMNKVLNENANEIVNEMGSTIEDTFGEICKQTANNLFSRVPYKTIFPMEEQKEE